MSTTVSNEEPPINLTTFSDQDKKDLTAADAVSTTNATTPSVSELSFTPVKALHINTQGIGVLRLSTPSSKLSTTIHNPDGSLAYTSTRATRRSGNCTLTGADGRALIGTTYSLGPNKDPVLKRLDAGEGTRCEVKMLSKWMSRNHEFLMPDDRTFSWRYKREKGFGVNGVEGTALVLEVGGKRVAALVRNNETRAPGSKACSAGNGGKLVLGEGVGGEAGISESLVVATCLLMLKKEIDRRRSVQFMVVAAAAV